jgi:PAS domain S-box-containing protein
MSTIFGFILEKICELKYTDENIVNIYRFLFRGGVKVGQRYAFFKTLNFFIEKKGYFILNLFSIVIGARLFFQMDETNHQVLAAIFAILFFLTSYFRKQQKLFYPLITTSILLFTVLAILSDLDFYTLVSIGNEMLILCAFLFPNPFSNLLIGAVLTSLLLTYHDTLSFYFIRGSMIELAVDAVFYSIFAYLIRYLFKKKLDLQESEKRNQLLLSMLPRPFIIHQDGVINFFNHEALKLVGGEKIEDALGKSIFQFILPEYHEIAIKRIQETSVTQGQNIPVELKIAKLNGEIIDIETTAAPFLYNGKLSILTLMRDITDAKNQKEELLQKSDKLSLVGQLAAGIAHEIRNPLTSLRGFIQLLQYKTEENKDYCDIMLSELDRINLIVGEFLVLAKPHMTQYSTKEMNPLVQHVVTLIGTQAIMNNIHIDYKFAPNLPLISCEENQLKQVIINLIKNAIEAMPNGGTIHVETGKHDDDHIFIEIADEGIGLSEEMIEKLGEPFYTTKEHGTGLGLMVCYRIIENHFGEMIVNSELNKGTTFRILLPTQAQTNLVTA